MARARKTPRQISLGTPSSKAALIWALCRRQFWWILLALVVAVAAIPGLTALSATALRDFVDDGVIEQTRPISELAIRLMVLAFLAAMSTLLLNQIIARILFHLEFELRLWLYEGLQDSDPRKLDTVATGQMVTRAMTDLEIMKIFVTILPYIFGYSIVLIVLSVVLLRQSVPLTILALLAIPGNVYLVMRMRRRLWGLSWMALNTRAQVTERFDESVRGIRVVTALGREEDERERVKDASENTYGVIMARTRYLAKYDFWFKAIPLVVNGGTILVAGRLIGAEVLTLGVLLVFVRYSREFGQFARSMDEFVNGWQYGKAAAGRIVELISEVEAGRGADAPPSSATDGASDPAEPAPAAPSSLSLHGVGVSFGPNTVLDDFTLEVAPGELVMVRGGPRTGKSTIAALASGDLAPTEGLVRFAGVDPALARVATRRRVRVLSEEPFLFGRSLRENLAMGAGGAQVADDVLLQAMHVAGASELLDELDGGLDAHVGDRGLTLSGGQRQRLALARTLVDPPELLVLDDALMAVNPSLEREIISRLREHAPQTGILLLTRREGPASLADRVLTLPPPAAYVDEGVAESVARTQAPPDPKLAAIVADVPPTDERPDVPDDVATWSDEQPGVVNVLKPFLVAVAGISGLLLVASVTNLVPNFFFREAVDAMEADNIRGSDRFAIGIIVLGWVVSALFYVLRIQRVRIQEKVVYLLRRRTFQRLTRLGIDYYDRELPGYVAARVVYDLDRIGEFMEDGPFNFASNITLLVLTFGVIVWWSPPIALVGGAFVPILIAVSAGYLPIGDRAYKWTRHELGETVARLQEDFAGRDVIRAYGAQKSAHDEFYTKAWELRRAQRWSTVASNAYIAAIIFLLDFAAAAVLWQSGNLVKAAVITTGMLFAIQLYVEQALAPIPRLAGVFRQYLVAKASFNTLRDPFRAEILPVEKPGVGACPRLAGELQLDGVRFAYPGTSRTVLSNASLEVAPGQMAAVVGPTGAGKSSIAKLLGRVYDPDEGVVRADGVNLRDYDLHSYRKRLGMVPQEAFCFRGTVASNLAYGRPEATREELESAARDVGAWEALMTLPGGLDALVEEEGRNLTSAQRQLIALTRAWVTNPDVLILDEATSTLDESMEQDVLEAVSRLGCSTVVITHRLTVAERADVVAVVDAGTVVEQGTHEELVGAGGAYARLWSLGPEVHLKAGDVDLGAEAASAQGPGGDRPEPVPAAPEHGDGGAD